MIRFIPSTFSFYCNEHAGHLRLGQFCFQWRNSFLIGSMYDGFGECQLTLGKRQFRFGNLFSHIGFF